MTPCLRITLAAAKYNPVATAERATMAAPEKNNLLGEMLAELLGTLVLIALGDGVVAMVVLFGKKDSPDVVHGGYTNITLGWGLAVLMGICVAGRTSGAHLNPAVTLALAIFRGFSWRKVPAYVAAQVVGAFLGAALVFVNYLPAFHEFDPLLERQETTGIFTTFPFFGDAWPFGWPFGLLDQVVGTALLIGLIFAITDPRNQQISSLLAPFAIALVVVAIGISWGGMHGYAINPARDFGPRLFTVVVGFQQTGFAGNVWWVPIVGPLLGGVIGGGIYDALIRPFLPKN
jgi:glycerol uptake facilitator protein